MAKESVGKALKDARIPYEKIQQAAVGYVYGKCFEMMLQENRVHICYF